MKAFSMDGAHDKESRAAITAAAETIAKALLDRKLWRTLWRVEIDGCVFSLRVDGYAKAGTPRWQEQRERDIALIDAADIKSSTRSES